MIWVGHGPKRHNKKHLWGRQETERITFKDEVVCCLGSPGNKFSVIVGILWGSQLGQNPNFNRKFVSRAPHLHYIIYITLSIKSNHLFLAIVLLLHLVLYYLQFVDLVIATRRFGCFTREKVTRTANQIVFYLFPWRQRDTDDAVQTLSGSIFAPAKTVLAAVTQIQMEQNNFGVYPFGMQWGDTHPHTKETSAMQTKG